MYGPIVIANIENLPNAPPDIKFIVAASPPAAPACSLNVNLSNPGTDINVPNLNSNIINTVNNNFFLISFTENIFLRFVAYPTSPQSFHLQLVFFYS